MTPPVVWVRACISCEHLDGRERWDNHAMGLAASVRPWSCTECGAFLFRIVAAQEVAQPQAIPQEASAADTDQDTRSRVSVLTDALLVDLAAAVRAGRPLVPVLRTHGVGRQSFYRWLWIGSGHRASWSDGAAVSHVDYERCHALAITLAEARVNRESAELARLRQAPEPGYTATARGQ